ncbi:hypothetical protein L7F22_004447 [Adiantum nelumboides]|nr:hypothetical protein [Adiantum nelumboides]
MTSDYSPSSVVSSSSEAHLPSLNSKILVVAIVIIFCFFFLIVILDIYFKRLCRRSRFGSFNRQQLQQGGQQASIPVRNTGLSKAAIASLPTFTYTEPTIVDTNPSQRASFSECAVCLSDFQENEKGRMLPACKHIFHIECIDMWFYSHSTCPLCRVMVMPTINNTSSLVPSLLATHEQRLERGQIQAVAANDIHIAIGSTSSMLPGAAAAAATHGIDDILSLAKLPVPETSPTHNGYTSTSTKCSRRLVPHITVDIPTMQDSRTTSPGCISLPSRRLRCLPPQDQPCSSHHLQSVESPGIRASLRRIMSMQAGKGKVLGAVDSHQRARE